MEAESKTPAAPLTGVELCERVAMGMGWVKHPRRDDGMWLCDKKDAQRSVVQGKHRWISHHSDSPCLDSWFRPDLDGNHLAEVKAECNRRDWPWMEAKSRQGMAHGMVNGYRVNAWDELPSSTAFLRAFVAASEAEKEKIQ